MLSTPLPLSLFLAIHFSPNIHPRQTDLNNSCKLDSSFCICFPFISATASWGVGSSLLRKPEIRGKTQRPAYLPQSGYEREPSALPSWGLALKTEDEKPSVCSELPTGRLEAPKQWRESKGKLNRSLRMKSEGLEIKPAGHPFSLAASPLL